MNDAVDWASKGLTGLPNPDIVVGTGMVPDAYACMVCIASDEPLRVFFNGLFRGAALKLELVFGGEGRGIRELRRRVIRSTRVGPMIERRRPLLLTEPGGLGLERVLLLRTDEPRGGGVVGRACPGRRFVEDAPSAA